MGAGDSRGDFPTPAAFALFFATNHIFEGKPPFVLKQDIRTVPDSDIHRALESAGAAELDCLIGGPPCQGFSQMRRTEERRGSEIVGFGG